MSVADSSVLPGATSGDTSLPEYSAEVPPDSLYHKLPTPISFRLLEIIKVFPYLTCKMRTVSLAESTLYYALSYCWGSPNRSVTLRCNGVKLKISSNLAEGLKRLHAHAVKAHLTWFWIDQICINQEDNAERTQQVRLMRFIYQRSIQTIIWLPVKNDIAKAVKSIITNFRLDAYSTNPVTPPMKDKRWTALGQLLKSPWFERCWVLQEIAASQGSPVVLCGNQNLTWPEFKTVIDCLGLDATKNVMARIKLVDSIQQIIDSYYRLEGPGDALSRLHVLLHLTSSFRSTDPRDKVFALLGLTWAGRDPDNWPGELAPDYARPVQDVYAAATKYCIQQTNSLSVLSQYTPNKMRRPLPPDSSFPSWVPRWDLADPTRRISHFHFYRDLAGLRHLDEQPNKASKGAGVEMDYDAQLSILRVLGMQVETVKVCFPPVAPDDPEFDAGVPERYGEYLSKLIPHLYTMSEKHVRQTSCSFAQTFFIATTAGLNRENMDSRHDQGMKSESIIHLVKYGAKARSAPKHAATPWMTLSVSNTQDQGQSSHDDVEIGSDKRSRDNVFLNRYIRSLQRLMNRRLFVTSSDHLGLGPASTMSGDTVVILFGGNVPYILRPLENKQWHFVGECYLDEYMDGEAMKDRDASRDEWFELV